MKIRRYLGKNTQEAILKVKMDLGNEAVILNTRKVRQKGILKFFAKPMVEVLAAIDEDYGKKKEKESQKQEEKPQVVVKDVVDKNKSVEKEEKIFELENKVSTMESLLNKIYVQLQSTHQKSETTAPEDKQQALPKVLQLLYNNLIKNEVEVDIAKKIIDKVSEKVGEEASVNESANALYIEISELLGKPETISLREDGKPTVVIFVGPTGVGKTTTLAKIAANFALNQKKKVGFITADTYRIAAVEQLKTYAEILGMPVSVVYSANEMEEAIKNYQDKDLILIDTAGRSYRNVSQFEELKAQVFASKADELFLVLSTTTSVRNCREILCHYDFMKDYKLIFTKLDETPINGIILNVKCLTSKRLSYMTIGQSVPDDIEIANIDKLTKNLLGSISK